MGFESETKENIRKNLIAFRKANGLKQKDVAAALNMKDESTYRSWESGRSCPKHSMLVRIARMYNISTDRILLNKSEIITGNLCVASENTYGKIYGDDYLSELENSEKLFIMRLRQLNQKDRQRVARFIEEISPKEDD